jgi:hypothetical protein
MTNDRRSGLALIAGSAGVIITLALHPSERALFAPGQLESAAHRIVTVHSLALACLPLWLFGACGLSRRVGSDNGLGVAGLIFYALGIVAMMNAVVVDGLVSPRLAREIVDATGTPGQAWRVAFNYNAMVDLAFMHVFLVASSAGILLWSASIVRTTSLARGAGIAGCFLGAAVPLAVLTGLLDRHLHLFLLAILGQAAWFMVVGTLLFRTASVEARAGA